MGSQLLSMERAKTMAKNYSLSSLSIGFCVFLHKISEHQNFGGEEKMLNEQQIITLMRIGGKIVSYLGLASTMSGFVISNALYVGGGLFLIIIGCIVHEVGEMID